jgi:hypothetical protein
MAQVDYYNMKILVKLLTTATTENNTSIHMMITNMRDEQILI